MLRQRIGLLLGSTFIKVDKSESGVLMQTMWLSQSTAEYEDSNAQVSVSLDSTLSLIKGFIQK